MYAIELSMWKSPLVRIVWLFLVNVSDEGLRKPETYRDVGLSDKKNRTILIYHDMKNFTF